MYVFLYSIGYPTYRFTKQKNCDGISYFFDLTNEMQKISFVRCFYYTAENHLKDIIIDLK